MKKTIYELSKEIWEVRNKIFNLHFHSIHNNPKETEKKVIKLEVQLSKLKQELEYAITTYKNENETK